MAAKKLTISVSVIFSPEYETVAAGSIYEIINRDEAIGTALEEVKRRIKENVPSSSDCSLVMGHKIVTGK